MNQSYLKRLKKLESFKGTQQRHKCAKVICDPEILQTFDSSVIDADVVLILPDNGRRGHENTIEKGSYSVWYS